MTRTRVVNRRHEDYDVNIMRPGPWGNPWVVRCERGHNPGSRAWCIERFRAYLQSRPDLIERARRELRGKRLGCVCAPHPCHGDVLARVADGGDP